MSDRSPSGASNPPKKGAGLTGQIVRSLNRTYRVLSTSGPIFLDSVLVMFYPINRWIEARHARTITDASRPLAHEHKELRLAGQALRDSTSRDKKGWRPSAVDTGPKPVRAVRGGAIISAGVLAAPCLPRGPHIPKAASSLLTVRGSRGSRPFSRAAARENPIQPL
jgi:hypothetical protein